jgi:hypothetical protein
LLKWLKRKGQSGTTFEERMTGNFSKTLNTSMQETHQESRNSLNKNGINTQRIVKLAREKVLDSFKGENQK